MKVEVRKEISKLFYIRSRNGIGTNEKTFVRVLENQKSGLGSKMYCSARHTALLFDNKASAIELMKKYNTSNANVAEYDYETHTPDFMKGNYILEEVQVKGIKCYRFIRK